MEKKDPQGIVETELVLMLNFGNLADIHATGSASVVYKEDIASIDTYLTVLVDEDNRKIANNKLEF